MRAFVRLALVLRDAPFGRLLSMRARLGGEAKELDKRNKR